MSKINDIKTALECCRGKGCKDCPYRCGNSTCISTAMGDAFELINELTEENERLKATKYMAYPGGRIEMIPTIESVKADTVREMQERLTSFFANDDNLKYNEVDAEYVNEQIDRIAKKMLKILDKKI